MTSAGVHPAAQDPKQTRAQCEVLRSRASGPGGQHRNKVQTAVTLRHRASGLVGRASERRSQSENLGVALFRLRVNLALEVRCPAQPEQPASALWKSRLRAGRIMVNPRHADFPALLAEALDMLAAANMDPLAAAAALGCTPSQLLKFLKDEPRAWALLNRHRQQAGLPIFK